MYDLFKLVAKIKKNIFKKYVKMIVNIYNLHKTKYVHNEYF